MSRRKRRRSEEIAQGYLLGVAHAVILLHKAGWGTKKRLPEFAEAMVDMFDQWQNGRHGYKEMIDQLEELTGLKIEEGK